MKSVRAVLLVIFGLVAALAVACGGGGSETAQSGQAASAAEEAGQSEQSGQGRYGSLGDGSDEVPSDGEQASEAAQPGGESDLFVSAGVFESGPRAGGRFNRTMLGDPDAPVVITDYADFL